MGWKHREAQRKKAAATARARKESRKSGSSSNRWWLTILQSKTCCANPACHGILRPGAEMVFRKVPEEALCVACADRAAIRYRPSVRWEQNRKAERDGGRGALRVRPRTRRSRAARNRNGRAQSPR